MYSRCRTLLLSPLDPESVLKILQKALKVGNDITVNPDSLEYLAKAAGGDARTALNCLEAVMDRARATGKAVGIEEVKEALKRGHLAYDKRGDDHYQCASALQKSIRGSDDNAALYWTVRMLEGGEDPMFIARRLVRIASEDVGLGDPSALTLAVSAMQGCQLIGKPECDVLLAQCAVYLARADKSHEVYGAMNAAKQHLYQFGGGNLPAVPLHLRNATSKLDRERGYGQGYSYNLAEVKNISYLPEEVDFKPFSCSK